MARGRIIDREIFTHEDLMEMPIEVRYLYHGLIVWADDEGRMKSNPKYLKAKIFPSDNISESKIIDMVNQMTTNGLLLGYRVGDEAFVQHPNWDRWQFIRKDRFKPSNYPHPPPLSVDGQPMVNQMSTNGQPMVDANKVKLSKVKLREEGRAQHPTLEQIKAYCLERRNSVDAEKWLNHYEANGWRVGRNSMKDWKAAVRTWEKNGFTNSPKEAPHWSEIPESALKK